jgi:hypothetical protein
VLAATFSLITPHLTERQRRLLFGVAARALGYGGASRVGRLAEVSRPTVRRGAAELDQPADLRGRIRQHDGPKRRATPIWTCFRRLDRLVDPDTRGDPQSPLRWTCNPRGSWPRRSPRPGIRSATTPLAGCSSSRATGCSARSRPWRAPSIPAVMPSSATSTSRPSSIWPPNSLGRNSGWVGVGTDHDTAAFAVRTLRRWWQQVGQLAYPQAERLLVCADAGGSNGYRVRAWKTGLARLAGETGLAITVGHLPPGASKVEPDRASAVQRDLEELARPAADKPRGDRGADQGAHDPHGLAGPRRAGPWTLAAGGQGG